VSSNPPGATIKLRILRDGKKIDVEAKIGSLEDAETAAPEGADGLLEKLGFAVEDITPEVTQRFGYEQGAGVVVTEVEAGSPADRKGLQPGDMVASVERKQVSSVADFKTAMSAAEKAGKEVVLLLIRRQRGRYYVAIPVPKEE
jgi:serine protease Do